MAQRLFARLVLYHTGREDFQESFLQWAHYRYLEMSAHKGRSKPKLYH